MTNAVTLKCKPVELKGTLPTVGASIKNFTLIEKALQAVSTENYAGKHKVLNIFPSTLPPTLAIAFRHCK